MANCCIILGKSGTGKSSSIVGLNPEETLIINVLGKKLPFKGSNSLYNSDKKNLFRVEDHTQLISLLEACNNGAKHIKNIVIDDAIYIMRKEYFRRAKEPGYTRFTEIAMHFQQIIATCERMREDINVFFMLHTDTVMSDNVIVGYKASTIGKLLEEQYKPEEAVTVLLFSDVVYDEQGQPTFGFYTHKVLKGNIEIPAKTPKGMFEEDFIPNDLGIVTKAMNEYYN